MNASWDILKTLSDPTRLRLLALLMREELAVAELQEILGMAQSRISSQLALLRQADLVTDRRDGKKAFLPSRRSVTRSAWRSRASWDEMRDWPMPRISCNSATDSSSRETRARSRNRVGSERIFRMSQEAFNGGRG